MSEIRVDTIKNDGTEVDFPKGFTVGDDSFIQVYSEGATNPTTGSDSELFWNTTNSTLHVWANGAWRSVPTS